MKVLESVVEGLIEKKIGVNEMQFGFMSDDDTTDIIFILCQTQEKCLAANRPLNIALVCL